MVNVGEVVEVLVELMSNQTLANIQGPQMNQVASKALLKAKIKLFEKHVLSIYLNRHPVDLLENLSPAFP